jgi:ATP/maltotriose-dependent transcriptional regulator MalT
MQHPPDILDLTNTLRGLRADELQRLARFYHRLAGHLEAEAARREDRDSERAQHDARMRELEGAPALVEALVAEGRDEAAAIGQVARDLDAPFDTVKMRLQRARKARADHARQLRNREILRLAARGWADADIARQVAVSKATVSRVVRANVETIPARPLSRPQTGAQKAPR